MRGGGGGDVEWPSDIQTRDPTRPFPEEAAPHGPTAGNLQTTLLGERGSMEPLMPQATRSPRGTPEDRVSLLAGAWREGTAYFSQNIHSLVLHGFGFGYHDHTLITKNISEASQINKMALGSGTLCPVFKAPTREAGIDRFPDSARATACTSQAQKAAPSTGQTRHPEQPLPAVWSQAL